MIFGSKQILNFANIAIGFKKRKKNLYQKLVKMIKSDNFTVSNRENFKIGCTDIIFVDCT